MLKFIWTATLSILMILLFANTTQSEASGRFEGIFSKTEFEEVLKTTSWPPELYPAVWEIAVCESPGPIPETIDQYSVGDLNLDYTGPSIGAMKINISAHRSSIEKYNVYDLFDNLELAHEIFKSSDHSFYPWLRCAESKGLLE